MLWVQSQVLALFLVAVGIIGHTYYTAEIKASSIRKKAFFNPILNEIFDQSILLRDDGKNVSSSLSTTSHENSKLIGMEVGVPQNFSEKEILSWWRHDSDVTAIFLKNYVVLRWRHLRFKFVHRFVFYNWIIKRLSQVGYVTKTSYLVI